MSNPVNVDVAVELSKQIQNRLNDIRMAEETSFTIIYKDAIIYVKGSGRKYMLSFSSQPSVVIEKDADGWFSLKDFEQHWTDHDISSIGALIEKKARSVIKDPG